MQFIISIAITIAITSLHIEIIMWGSCPRGMLAMPVAMPLAKIFAPGCRNGLPLNRRLLWRE